MKWICRWRRIQNLGLSKIYNDPESEEGKWLRHIFGLTYLNPEDVGDCVAFDFAADQPDNPKITSFMNYLVDNYLDENSTFPPAMWAENTSSLARTTNSCEGFHSKFNGMFPSPHPNINVFISNLKLIQSDTYLKLNSVLAKEKRYVRPDVLKKKKFLDEKIQAYRKNNLSRYEFVKLASYQFSFD